MRKKSLPPQAEKPARFPRCRCGDWPSVKFFDSVETDTVILTGNVPTLECQTCKTASIPDSVGRVAAHAAKAPGRRYAFSPDERRFTLCRSVEFTYYGPDCDIIPGLKSRKSEVEGYYVPVFFDRGVLLTYTQSGTSAIGQSVTSTQITFQDGFSLPYGINRNGLVFCWLGDLDKAPLVEQRRMSVHNVASDHDVISSMYKKDRLGMDLDTIPEERLKNAIYDLELTSETHVKFAIHQIRSADRHIAEKLERPRTWHRDTTQAVLNLVKVCIESIDADALKKDINSPGDEAKGLKDLKSLKLLQLWIGMRLHVNAELTMKPFFALYDWRNYLVHRAGSRKFLGLFKAARVRMGMDANDDDDERLYGLLLDGMTESCRVLAAGIKAM